MGSIPIGSTNLIKDNTMNQKIRCANCKHIQEEWFNYTEEEYVEVRCESCGKKVRFKVQHKVKSNNLPPIFKDIFGDIFQ